MPFPNYVSITHLHDARRGTRQRLFVGDQDDSFPSAIQFAKQIDDVFTGLSIEIAGRFVCEQDGRIVYERARDGDTLLLTAG